MPTCTTIIMYLFNPTISIIVDGVERVLPLLLDTSHSLAQINHRDCTQSASCLE